MLSKLRLRQKKDGFPIKERVFRKRKKTVYSANENSVKNN